MDDIIVALVLVAIAAAAIVYIIRARRRGEKCIGCPHSRQCGGKCSGGCSLQGKE